MSKKLKVLALVLVAVLTLSVFAGCKNKETQGSSSVLTSSETEADGNLTAGDPEGEDTSDVASEDKEVESTDKGDKNENKVDKEDKEEDKTSSTTSKGNTIAGKPNQRIDINKTGWPIVNKPITFEIFGQDLPSRGDPTKMTMFKWIEKTMNIKVKYIGVVEGKISERRTLMLQSGDMPDLFAAGSFDDLLIAKYSAGKKPAIVDAMTYINQGYAPTLKKILEDETVKSLNMTEDGKLFTIPNQPDEDENYDHWFNINKTWMETLGIVEEGASTAEVYEAVNTPEKFFSVLEQFRDDDPDQDGEDDQWPLAIWNWSASMIIGMHGVYATHGGVGIDLDYKAYYPYATKSALRGCTFWNRIKTADRMFDESIPGKSDGYWAAFTTHIKEKDVGAFFWSYLGDSQFGADKLKDYVAIPKPGSTTTESGLRLSKAVNAFSNNLPDRGNWVISSDCSNVPAMVRLLDFFASDYGVMVGNLGEPGKNFVANNDGTYTIKIAGDADYQNAMGWAMGINELKNQLYDSIKREKVNEANDTYNKYLEAANKTYAQANIDNPVMHLPDIQLTAKEIAQLRKFESAGFDNMHGSMSLFMSNTTWKLSEWDTRIDAWYKKGLQEYVNVYQGIIDRNKSAIINSGEWCKNFSAFV